MDHVQRRRGAVLGAATVLAVLASLGVAGQSAAASGRSAAVAGRSATVADKVTTRRVAGAAPGAAGAVPGTMAGKFSDKTDKSDMGAESGGQASKVEPAPNVKAEPAANVKAGLEANAKAESISGTNALRKAPARSVTARNGFETHLRAGYVESSIVDNASSGLILTIERDTGISTGLLTGIGFTIALPQYLVVASNDVDNNCTNATFAPSYGATTLVVSGAELSPSQNQCTLSVLVMSSRSGTYALNNSMVTIDGGDIGSGITADTLVVKTRLPRLSGRFDPDDIDAGQTSTLTMNLYRSDQNPSVVTSGIAWRLTLPAGVLVVSAGAGDCGGTVTAVPKTRVVTLVGGVIGAGDSYCDVATVVRGTMGGKYKIESAALTQLKKVELALGACMGSAAGDGPTIQQSCNPSLKVSKLAQTVTFEQPGTRKVGTSSLDASASSGLPVGFTSSTTDVCQVEGATLTVLSEGVCTVTAGQAGNAVYASAHSVERTIEILPRPPAPPTVAGIPGTSSITVVWTAPLETGAITDYEATARSGDLVTSCVSTELSCVLGAVADRPYIVTAVSRGPNGTSTVTRGEVTVTASAPVLPDSPPDTDLVLTTTDGQITTAEPGQLVIFVGKGFAPFSTVTISIFSKPTTLGTAITNAAGAFRKPITVPPGLAVGGHTAVAQGVAPDGTPRSMALDITVVGLPVTGPGVATMLLVGFGSMLTGGLALFAARPRRRTRAC